MSKLLRRLWYLITRKRRQAELVEEMEFHQAMKTRELQSEGVAKDDVTVEVRRAFGSTALAHDEARDAWVWPWLQDVWSDVRFAIRLLVKDPRFTVTAVLALALGIAVNNTIFTLINTAMFRDLPFDQPDRLVSIGTRDPRGLDLQASFLDFNDWRASSRAFIGMAATTGGAMSIADDAHIPDRVRGAYVSANTFNLLRVEPLIGRDFVATDEVSGSPAVVVLGYGLWQRRYGGDRSILGRTIRVNDVPSTVIGVMPADFRFPFSDEVWQPLALASGLRGARRDMRSLNVFGRLADSQSIDQARADLSAIVARMAAEYPDTNKGIVPRLAFMNDRMQGAEIVLGTLMGSVVFVLMIACANVANLLMARVAGRAREIAIRASLGATRWRFCRQLLIECGIVAALAGILGLAISVYGVSFLGVAFNGRPSGAPASAAAKPYWVDLSMNAPVYFFLGFACLLVTLLTGLVPALHASRANTNEVLKESGKGGAAVRAWRWTGSFVIAQLALALILLTGAGLMVRSFVTLYQTDRVIDTEGLVTARLALPSPRYASPEARRRFFESLAGRLSSASVLSSFAMASDVPFMRVGSTCRLALEAQADESADTLPTVSQIHADARYVETLGLRLMRGRSFEAADGRPGQEAVLINNRLAAMFFPGEDPIGRRIRLLTSPGAPDAQPPWRTVVGIVPDIPQAVGNRDASRPTVIIPLFGETTPSVISLFARTKADIGVAVTLMREEVRALDPDLPLYYVQTLEDVFADARVPARIIGTWFSALALIALALATVGLYAITRHSVTQRTQEIGVRVALGAATTDVVWMFLRRTVAQVAIGVAIGLSGALALAHILRSTPFVGPTSSVDPLTLASVTILLVAAAIFATLLPARHAARIDPLAALRYE